MQSRPRDPFDKNKAVYEHQGSVSAHQVTGLQPTETLAFDRHFKTPGRVLDLGCGTGRTSVELLKRGHNVDAIDYSQSMIDEALRQHPSTQIRFAVMDARNLHFPDATFDYALFSFNGLDYLYPATERMVALRQIWRVLKPGGVFAFTAHNSFWVPSTWPKRQRLLRSFLRGKIAPYRIDFQPFGELSTYCISPWSQRRQLARAGFTLLHMYSAHSRFYLGAIIRDPYPMYIAQKPASSNRTKRV
jgi:ubiquinone/menaquinone biosynthesis C-methylase UbiE